MTLVSQVSLYHRPFRRRLDLFQTEGRPPPMRLSAVGACPAVVLYPAPGGDDGPVLAVLPCLHKDNIRQLMTRADHLFALHDNKQGGKPGGPR
jgi:hypothetical protein